METDGKGTKIRRPNVQTVQTSETTVLKRQLHEIGHTRAFLSLYLKHFSNVRGFYNYSSIWEGSFALLFVKASIVIF
jgi:hypothetical protein